MPCSSSFPAKLSVSWADRWISCLPAPMTSSPAKCTSPIERKLFVLWEPVETPQTMLLICRELRQRK